MDTSKPSEVFENGKFVLDYQRTHPHTHTRTHIRELPSRDVERSHGASVNLSVVYRSAFSYETPATIILWHFLVSFLPPSVAKDQGSATYPIFVSVGQRTESWCAPSSVQSPRSRFYGMKGTQVGRRLPKGNIFLSASLTLFSQWWSNSGWSSQKQCGYTLCREERLCWVTNN